MAQAEEPVDRHPKPQVGRDPFLNAMGGYRKFVKGLLKAVPTEILDPSQPRARSRAPSMAFSEFVINREMGDWAETSLAKGINDASIGWRTLKYGKSDRLVAGEHGFKEFYERFQDELDTIGKRPDLLLVTDETRARLGRDDLSSESVEGLIKLTPKTGVGIEVRSSSRKVAAYHRDLHGKSGRDWVSFTPKVEDLMVVWRWIEKFDLPHVYTQVFFDEVFAIPFHRILEIISDRRNKGELFTIEKYAKNQQKSTIYLDVQTGISIGRVIEMPSLHPDLKELERGRLLFYLRFENGPIAIDRGRFSAALSDLAKYL